jgi:hypothetical protein
MSLLYHDIREEDLTVVSNRVHTDRYLINSGLKRVCTGSLTNILDEADTDF